MYALYAWGNFFNYESGFDRKPGWLDPALLAGEPAVLDENLSILDNGPLLVDGAGTLFEIDDELVAGRDLAGRDLTGVDWSVAHIRLATDGTRADALRITGLLEETGEIFADESPERNPLGFGEVVTTWEDDHGQWDLALIRL